MGTARAHAKAIVAGRVATGAEGYHGPVIEQARGGAREADDATRGSAIKVGAEVVSRLLGLAATLLLLWGLGASDFGLFVELSAYALLLAELGELGLQALASRALVAGTHSLASLVRARLALAGVVAAAAVAVVPIGCFLAGRLGGGPADGVTLGWLVLWFALSGWAEFLGVALRCRGARRLEALLLLVLRGSALALVALSLEAGAGLRGVSAALAASPLPAIAFGAASLRRSSGPGASVAVVSVLRESAPLAVHGGLLLLSPRVEFLVLSWLHADRQAVGVFAAALNVVWFLSMVPTAVAAGAMPALTREALGGGAAVRRRTAGTLALIAAPAAVGLALVARSLAVLLLRAGYAPADYAAAAFALRVLSAALPALFLNALLSASLIASGRAAWLPRLTAARAAVAFALAFLLVPALGPAGAALGFVLAEWLLLLLGWVACRSAAFEVGLARPLGWALLACVPMSLAVSGVRESLGLALTVGVLTWAATIALGARLRPALGREMVGHLRYP
jgi:O-antigen/teichoic acid export membrane protein